MSLDAIMFCPHCHWYTAGNAVCPRCGVSLSQTDASEVISPVVPPAPVEMPSMVVEAPLVAEITPPPPVEAPPAPTAATPPATPQAPPAASNADDFVIRDGVLEAYKGYAKRVRIPAGVRVIAAEAFERNKVIERVEIPDGVKEIAGHAFLQCDSLAYVRIPSSVDVIHRQAFASSFDPRYPITGRVALPALREVEMTETQWKKYYYLFPHTQQGKRITQQKQWRERNLCQHCGGKIAFLNMQCKNCGRMKDY